MKQETVQAFHGAVSEDDDEDLLVLREKTKDEIEREEEEYKEFLEREVGQDLHELITVAGDDEPKGVKGEEDEAKGETKEERKRMKKEKKRKAKDAKKKEDEDQQFLLEYVC